MRLSSYLFIPICLYPSFYTQVYQSGLKLACLKTIDLKLGLIIPLSYISICPDQDYWVISCAHSELLVLLVLFLGFNAPLVTSGPLSENWWIYIYIYIYIYICRWGCWPPTLTKGLSWALQFRSNRLLFFSSLSFFFISWRALSYL